MNDKYKGIYLERIKHVQKINFPHLEHTSEMVKLDLKKNFYLDDFKGNDSVIDAVRLQIESYQNKMLEEKEMFIICEMAKLFLEEKQEQKKAFERIVERLEVEHEKSEYCPKFEKVFRQVAFEEAIEIVKEEGGLNE